MRIFVTLAAATLVGAPALASAQTYAGAGQILRGDFPAAERTLVAAYRLSRENPEVMLNLAVVYARTDRPAEARALYRAVLAQPDEDMTLASGAFVSSHRLAEAALAQLDTRTVAAN